MLLCNRQTQNPVGVILRRLIGIIRGSGVGASVLSGKVSSELRVISSADSVCSPVCSFVGFCVSSFKTAPVLHKLFRLNADENLFAIHPEQN